MASYWQWAKKRVVARVTWVCGPEVALRRDVVAAHRQGAVPGQCVTLFAGDAPEHETWDELLSAPPPAGRRAVVYGAEKLTALGNVALLASAPELATAYVVLVSAAADFERENGKLVPHLAGLQASRQGQLVRCCEPSKPEDRAALVASWWPGASLSFARDVLSRCGSLERAWLACEQARLADLKPAAAMVAVTCPAEPAGDLADLLMAGNRRAAAVAAGRVTRGEAGAAIGLLAFRLAAVEQVRAGAQPGMSLREAASRQRVDHFTAGLVIPVIGAYDAGRIRRCRRLLAEADTAWRSGARDGVAESLAARW